MSFMQVSRVLRTSAIKFTRVAAVARPCVARPFSGAAAAIPQVTVPPAAEYDAALDTKEICLKNCPPDHLFVNEATVYDSLEWTLTSPPPIHQFEEPPIIVEIEHLDNLVVPEDV